MKPLDFLKKCHYHFLEHQCRNKPVSPGFHDIGGIYTTMSITQRGIIDLPFHINRLYQSGLFLDYFQESTENKARLVHQALRVCHEVLVDNEFQEGLLIVCCGKARNLKELVDLNAIFSAKPFTTMTEDNLPCIVNFYPMHRDPAQVKYTRWVIERQPIIDRRDQNVQETIIFDEDRLGQQDRLTEGLTSTFYLFLDKQKILMPPTETILYGTIQRWIQFIAPLLNLTIIERPILFCDILQNAKGAFLTSSGRILQPIHRMRISPEIQSKYGSEKSEISFDSHEGELLEKLKVIAFHLMYGLDPSRNSNSARIVAAEELQDYEDKVLRKIGYHPWLRPRQMIWGNELIEESLIFDVINAMNLINSVT